MTYIETKAERLKNSVISPYAPDDFDSFWAKELEKERADTPVITRKVANFPYKNMMVYDVTYTTLDKTTVHGYFTTPVNVTQPLPCVIHYHGGSGSGTVQWDYPAVDICCLCIDVRGQNGISPDRADYTSGDQWSHAIVSGILNKEEYYLKNVYMDAVRAVHVAQTFPEVDPNRIGVKGTSQGGGITLAVAGLCPEIKAAVSTVPSYTCIQNRIEDKTGVLGNINTYMKLHPEHTDLVWNNVAYFDGLNFAPRIQAKTLVCCALADPICLPQYVYSAYDALKCEKEVFFAPFTPHQETDAMIQKKLAFFMKEL